MLSRKVCFCQLYISLWNVTCAFFSFTALYVLIQIPNAYLFAKAPILPKLQNYTFSILGSQNISGIINPLFMRSHAWIWMEINGLHLRSMGRIFQAITKFWPNVNNQQEVMSVLPDISYSFEYIYNLKKMPKNPVKKPFILWRYQRYNNVLTKILILTI